MLVFFRYMCALCVLRSLRFLVSVVRIYFSIHISFILVVFAAFWPSSLFLRTSFKRHAVRLRYPSELQKEKRKKKDEEAAHTKSDFSPATISTRPADCKRATAGLSSALLPFSCCSFSSTFFPVVVRAD